MTMVYVSPAPGRRVRDPFAKMMLPIGNHYLVDNNNTFWFKRIEVGDVLVDENQEPAPSPAAPASAAALPAPAPDGEAALAKEQAELVADLAAKPADGAKSKKTDAA